MHQYCAYRATASITPAHPVDGKVRADGANGAVLVEQRQVLGGCEVLRSASHGRCYVSTLYLNLYSADRATH